MFDIQNRQRVSGTIDDIESFNQKIIQYALDLVELINSIRDGSISKIAAYTEYTRIRNMDGFKICPVDPFVVAEKESIARRIQENLEVLKRLGLKDSRLYISALDELARFKVEPIRGRNLSVFKYFVKHPSSTIGNASRELGCHPDTISKALNFLRTKHWFRFRSTVNRWSFGLRTILLFFDLASEASSEDFFSSIFHYPFLNAIHEDSLNRHHYISFIFPNDSALVNQFGRSIDRLAYDYFRYWNLKEGIASGFAVNTDLMSDSGWSFPEEATNLSCLPNLLKSFQPMVQNYGVDKSLTNIDLIVTDALTSNCFLSSKELVDYLHSFGVSMSKSSAYRRKKHLLDKSVIIPVPTWYDQLDAAYLRIEISGPMGTRNHILAAALKMPYIAYFLTSESVVLWLNVTLEHLQRYVAFFNQIDNSEDGIDMRLTMGKGYSTSRFLSDITKNWKFGLRGYTVEGLDINPDINDYIQ